jgi:hypothetical protein
MASDTQSLHTPSDRQLDKQKAKCSISFENDKVHLVVEQPDRAAAQRYNSAQMQCLQHMVDSPPTTFDCEISGRVSAPRTEVILQRAMVEKLPLLLDITQSTSSARQAAIELELPCSLWGFVSLLLLLEGNMKLNHWFRGDRDTALPTQTLLVCTSGYKCDNTVCPRTERILRQRLMTCTDLWQEPKLIMCHSVT